MCRMVFLSHIFLLIISCREHDTAQKDQVMRSEESSIEKSQSTSETLYLIMPDLNEEQEIVDEEILYITKLVDRLKDSDKVGFNAFRFGKIKKIPKHGEVVPVTNVKSTRSKVIDSEIGYTKNPSKNRNVILYQETIPVRNKPTDRVTVNMNEVRERNYFKREYKVDLVNNVKIPKPGETLDFGIKITKTSKKHFSWILNSKDGINTFPGTNTKVKMKFRELGRGPAAFGSPRYVLVRLSNPNT